MNHFHRTIDRRTFIKETSRATVGLGFMVCGLASCAPHGVRTQPDETYAWSGEFDIKDFDRWFRRNRLYNGENPYLKKPHMSQASYRFKASLRYSGPPCIGYTVPDGETMVASATGQVATIEELGREREGLKVGVHHPNVHSIYRTYYAYLSEVDVKELQRVERGEPIGKVTTLPEYAKLLFWDGNWLDPDNYGLHHGYMRYMRDHEEPIEEPSTDEIAQREKDQWAALKQLSGLSSIALPDYSHHGRRDCTWSAVERFRYLECLYQANPGLFPSLTGGRFESLKKQFYENQPIILTLPFRRK
jgi:hypothetical protein